MVFSESVSGSGVIIRVVVVCRLSYLCRRRVSYVVIDLQRWGSRYGYRYYVAQPTTLGLWAVVRVRNGSNNLILTIQFTLLGSSVYLQTMRDCEEHVLRR